MFDKTLLERPHTAHKMAAFIQAIVEAGSAHVLDALYEKIEQFVAGDKRRSPVV